MVSKIDQPKESAEKTKTPQTSWPDFAVSLYDKLTGRGAEITYEFDNFDIFIPAKMGEDVEHFHWKMNGILHIRTRDQVNEKKGKE